MKIKDIISYLESVADPSLQESYDNAGLITGDADWECNGILCALDATEDVISEAVARQCNLIITHHPIIFRGLKKINGKNHVERTVIRAIQNNMAIYAIHTNLDNVIDGVSGRMAGLLSLQNVKVLQQKEGTLKKIYTYVPAAEADAVRQSIFGAGGGKIGNYSECSFNAEGTGTFKAGAGAQPYVGEIGRQHTENETKIEVIFPSYLERSIINALKAAHPYEEPAYEILNLSNTSPGIGAGLVGELPVPMDERALLIKLKEVFNVPTIRHTAFLDRPVKRVALCGGAGSFLIANALAAGADVYITSDIKYHEFFEADKRLLIADIGHYESEQFTINLLHELLAEKFLNFAVLKTAIQTNPVGYF